MTGSSLQRIAFGMGFGILAFAFTAPLAAETVKIEGMIVARNGDEVTVQFLNGPELTLVLTDRTEVSQVRPTLRPEQEEQGNGCSDSRPQG